MRKTPWEFKSEADKKIRNQIHTREQRITTTITNSPLMVKIAFTTILPNHA
jgi:hypothetical protein